MTDFAVQYSFTCASCNHANEQLETIVHAESEVDAARTIFVQARCTQCGAAMPGGHPFITRMKEL